MLVLGWHGGWEPASGSEGPRSIGAEVAGHDAAAAIVKDGVVIAAVEEERLTRVKHSRAFPQEAIQFCLDQAGASFSDLDAIVTDTSESFMDDWVARRLVEQPRDTPSTARAHIAGLFAQAFDVDTSAQHRFCGHHLAHTIAAWRCSEFDSALSICVDGLGDGPSGLVADLEDDKATPLRYLRAEQSLGHFYVRSIAHLGYRLFDEYKVMGLAPYGDPATYRPLFSQMYALRADGRFDFADEATRRGLVARIAEEIAGQEPAEAFSRAQMDYAAALQEAVETIAFHLIEDFQKTTRRRRLCLSGGVAHNCSMNGRIVRSGLFEQVYIHPASHDAGNAIGAALSVGESTARRGRAPMPHAFLGPDIGDGDRIAAILHPWRGVVDLTQVEDAPADAARLIADGKVIAWVQGRSEFGPRALGNRSILADPRPAANKSRINAMIKKREAYRPFAPSVLDERLADYFESPPQMRDYPTMSVVLPVRPEAQELLGAVTHVDGTARVQTVSVATNPAYHALISAFGRLTGVPVVLNTSFNNDAEPIVDSVEDALACFLTTDLDAMIVGNWRVEKPANFGPRTLAGLAPRLRRTQRLVCRQERDGASYFVEADGTAPFPHAPRMLDADVYGLLTQAGPNDSIQERCERLSVDVDEVMPALLGLWAKRAIVLSPPGPRT